MTLRQTLESTPTKTKDLLDRLSNTSNQAIKTRENLLAELTEELPLYLGLEEQHLVPHLHKNAKTKAFAADAVKAHTDLKERLGHLAAARTDTDEFLGAVSKLRPVLQQHVSNMRKGVPILLEVLSDEDEKQILVRIEADIAAAAKAERATKRFEAAARQTEEQAAAAEQAAMRAQRTAARKVGETAERAADTVAHGVSVAEGGVRRVAGAITSQAQSTAGSAREALGTYQDTAREAGTDLQALGTSSGAALSAFSELQSVWTGWAAKALRVNLDAMQQLVKCRSLQDVAEVQRNVVSSQFHEIVERRREVLHITDRTVKKALQPLDSRSKKTA